MPGVGLIIEGAHAQEAFVAEGLGNGFHDASQLDLPHPFVEHFGDLGIDLLCDGRRLLHETDLEGRFLSSHGLGQGRDVDKLLVSHELLELEHRVIGHDIELHADPAKTPDARLDVVRGLHGHDLFEGRFFFRPPYLPLDKKGGGAVCGHEEKGVLHGA